MTEKITITLSMEPPTEITLLKASFFCPRCGELRTWFIEDWGSEDNAGNPVICQGCAYVFMENGHYPSGNGYTPPRHQEIFTKLLEIKGP